MLQKEEVGNDGMNIAEESAELPSLPPPPKYTEKKAVFYCIMIASSWLSVGYALAYSSNAQIAYERGGILSEFYKGLYGSILPLGAIFGSLLSGTVILKGLGFRSTLVLSSGIFALAWLCHIYILIPTFDNFPGQSTGLLIFSRMVVGISVGISTQCAPMYIGEVTPHYLRQVLGILPGFMVAVGNFFSTVIGFVLLRQDRINALDANSTSLFNKKLDFSLSLTYAPLVGFMLAVLNMIFATMCPYIKAKGLKFLAGSAYATALPQADSSHTINVDNNDSKHEVQITRESIKTIFTDTWRTLSKRNVKKQLFVGIIGMFFNQALGVNAILFNSTQLFLEAFSDDPNNPTDASKASCLMGLMLCISLIGMFLGGQFLKKKTVVYISSTIVCLCHLFIALYFQLHWKSPSAVSSLILIFMLFYNAGWGAVPWIVMSEIFEEDAKFIGSGITTFCVWGFSFLITVTYNPLVDIIHESGIFFIYFAMGLLSFPYILFVLPETKWKTAQEIQAMFN